MSFDETGFLERNLEHVEAGLADRIRQASALPRSTDGQPAVRRHRTLLSLVLPPDLRVPPNGTGELVVGVGLGERVSALLETGEAELLAWDPRAAALREALVRHDWSAALASGRLVLGAGLDLALWLASDRPLAVT